MSRPRSPRSQLTAGSLAHNKNHYAARDQEPKSIGELGRPSKWLTKPQKKIWKELQRNSPVVLGKNDRCLMEVTVILKSKLEVGNLAPSELTQYLTCLNKIGMIPPDRKPVASDPLPEAPVNPWESLQSTGS